MTKENAENHLKSTRSVGRKDLTLRILIPVAITLVLLIIVELFLQLAMPLPFSDRLYWVPDGHVKARLDYPQQVINADGNPVAINDLGFRGPNRTWRPEPGTLRIAVLGGSAAFCFQVSDDDHTWPAQLEKILHHRLKMPVEVVNLGLPGFDTSNSKVNYLFTGRALNPHAVLVYHTWNDLKFLRSFDDAQDGGVPRIALSGKSSTGSNSSLLSRIFRRLQIVRRIDNISTRLAAQSRENRYTSLEKEGARAHQPIGDRSWRWFEKNFDDVVRFIQMDGALPVLVSQATLAKASAIGKKEIRLKIMNDFVGMTYDRLARSYQHATRLIERVADRNGAVYINGYDAVPPTLENLNDHVHLLDPGAERLATAVAAGLLRNSAFKTLVDDVKFRK